ncbi:MAG: hypothetical protein WBI82_14575 [Sphaerochaeta sp.]
MQIPAMWLYRTYISPNFHYGFDNVLLVGNTLVHSILDVIEFEEIGYDSLTLYLAFLEAVANSSGVPEERLFP